MEDAAQDRNRLFPVPLDLSDKSNRAYSELRAKGAFYRGLAVLASTDGPGDTACMHADKKTKQFREWLKALSPNELRCGDDVLDVSSHANYSSCCNPTPAPRCSPTWRQSTCPILRNAPAACRYAVPRCSFEVSSRDCRSR